MGLRGAAVNTMPMVGAARSFLPRVATQAPGRLERRIARGLDAISLLALLAVPLFLTHFRGIAEALIDVVAVGLLLRSALRRDFAWAASTTFALTLLWWAWLVVCSIPVAGLGQGGGHSFVQALMTIRFPVFAFALPGLLRTRRRRAWLAGIVAGCCLYMLAQCALQMVTGHNLFGTARYPDGSLTGPYRQPRVGPVLSRLIFPVMLPASVWLLVTAGRRRGVARVGLSVLAAASVVLPVLMMVMVGQRMPLLLTVLGLLVAGLMIARLRLVVLLGCLLAPVGVAASAVIAPPAFHHLVTVFCAQIAHFPSSAYGRIAWRAVVIAHENLFTGRGFDGFRTGCPMPVYFQGLFGADGGGARICVQHPHNHYLQAATDAGLPGLVLFCAMILAWLMACGRGLVGRPARAFRRLHPIWQAWRVGLFVALFIHEWPIASTSAFTNMPLGGWFFLLLGLGLTGRQAYMQAIGQTNRPEAAF